MLAAIVAVQRLSCFESSAVIREVVLHTQVIYDSAYVGILHRRVAEY